MPVVTFTKQNDELLMKERSIFPDSKENERGKDKREKHRGRVEKEGMNGLGVFSFYFRCGFVYIVWSLEIWLRIYGMFLYQNL